MHVTLYYAVMWLHFLVIVLFCTSAMLLYFFLSIVAPIQIKVAKGVEMCATARPIIDISLSMRRGLEVLQRGLEERKMKRLNDRVRNSTSLSVAF